MEKLLAMQVAAMLTDGVLSGVGPPLSIVEDFSYATQPDGSVKVTPSKAAAARNIIAWETFRTFFWAIVAADKDGTNWPDPHSSGAPGSLSGFVAQLAPLASGLLAGPNSLTALAPQILQLISQFSKQTPPSNQAPSLPNLPPLVKTP